MNKEIFKKLKNLKFKEIIYPIIMVLFLIIIASVFIAVAYSIASTINKIFNIKDKEIESKIITFNVNDFEKVKKRLGIDDKESVQLNQTLTPAVIPALSENPLVLLSPSPALSPLPIISSVVAPSAQLDKKLLKIQVLNGVGEKGLAKIVKDFLEKSGFIVNDTRNADKFSYKSVVIKTKDIKRDYNALVEMELMSNGYTVGAKETLSENDSYDMIIIIGK